MVGQRWLKNRQALRRAAKKGLFWKLCQKICKEPVPESHTRVPLMAYVAIKLVGMLVTYPFEVVRTRQREQVRIQQVSMQTVFYSVRWEFSAQRERLWCCLRGWVACVHNRYASIRQESSTTTLKDPTATDGRTSSFMPRPFHVVASTYLFSDTEKPVRLVVASSAGRNPLVVVCQWI